MAGADLLPRARAALEVPERLGELEGLGNDALPLLIVAELGVASEGEVLAEGVALEAVVGHDAAEVRVVDEEDAEEVVDLALVPVGALVEGHDGGDRRGLVGVGLDTDAGVVADGEEIVDDLEALRAGGVVGGCDGADLGELGGGVVCVWLAIRSGAREVPTGRMKTSGRRKLRDATYTSGRRRRV